MTKRFLIGTSGWMYRDWNGVFYPNTVTGTSQLPFYAERFPTVEVNSTFYHMPRATTTKHWQEITPDTFCFSIKMNRYLTHTKRLLIDDDSRTSLNDFIDAISQLGQKLGVVLVQLPPSLRCDPQRLSTFIMAFESAAKKRHITVPLALEFRHASWFTDEVRQILKYHGAAQVINDSPNRWPADLSVPSDIAYIRFHGNKRLYRSSYSDKELREWVDFMQTACNHCKTIFIYFNNDYHAVAVKNAQSLTQIIADL
jgi:uncharacterized protein YecE (DUF72 family)